MIAFVTADLSAMAGSDPDWPPLEQAFEGRAPVDFVRWDDPGVDWSAYDLVVLRSTWDYPGRIGEFTLWLRRVAAVTRVLNPPRTLAWNLDKAYLGALAAGGVPVVRTSYVDTLPDFDDHLAALRSRQIVVKPTVSAGSGHTGRFDHGDPAARHLAGQILDLGKRVMVQPYQESVTRDGEVAVIHLGGAFSHAVRKGPILASGGGFLQDAYTESIEAVRPTDAQLAVATRVLDGYRALATTSPALAGTEPLLYARVDLIAGDDGEPVLLELELIEPSLFFETDEAAAGRYADAVLARL